MQLTNYQKVWILEILYCKSYDCCRLYDFYNKIETKLIL